MTKPGVDPELEHVKAPGPNIFAWHPSARYLMGFNQLSSICDAGGPLPIASSLRIISAMKSSFPKFCLK